MNGSLIFNHMQVVDECRLIDSVSQTGTGAAGAGAGLG